MDDFWHWLNYTAVPSLRCDNWYNNKRPVGMRGFLGDTVSRLMGFATLRQLRVKKGQPISMFILVADRASRRLTMYERYSLYTLYSTRTVVQTVARESINFLAKTYKADADIRGLRLNVVF